MELRTHLMLSVGHVTQEVAVALDAIAREEGAFGDWRDHIICRSNGEFGWWLYVERRMPVASDVPFPECLNICMALARASNVEWLLFDSDMDPSSGIPFYDW